MLTRSLAFPNFQVFQTNLMYLPQIFFSLLKEMQLQLKMFLTVCCCCSFHSQFNNLFQHMPCTNQVIDTIATLISMDVQISPDISHSFTEPGEKTQQEQRDCSFFYASYSKKNKKLLPIQDWLAHRRTDFLPPMTRCNRLLQYGLLMFVHVK